MEEKKQFQKIMEWMRQINKAIGTLQDGQDRLNDHVDLLRKTLNLRIDALDERFDNLSEAVQALLKVIRKVRVDQYDDRTRFQKEIQKIRQEIRELMH